MAAPFYCPSQDWDRHVAAAEADADAAAFGEAIEETGPGQTLLRHARRLDKVLALDVVRDSDTGRDALTLTGDDLAALRGMVATVVGEGTPDAETLDAFDRARGARRSILDVGPPRDLVTRPDDYVEAPHGVDCPGCHGSGDVDRGDGPYGAPQIHPCATCYGTGRVPDTDD